MPPPNDYRDPRARGRPYPEPDRIRWEPLYAGDPAEDGGRATDRRPSGVPRFIALSMFIGALAALALFSRQILAFVGMIGRLADRPTQQEAFIGFVALGLIVVALLAALRIVLDSQSRRR